MAHGYRLGFFLLFAFLAMGDAYVSQYMNFVTHRGVKKCLDSDSGVIHEVGDVWYTNCEKRECGGPLDAPTVSILGCGLAYFEAKDGCELVSDEEANYPDCCVRMECAHQ